MKRKSRARKIAFFLVAIFAVLGAVFFSFQKNVKPVVFTYCDALIASLGMDSINKSSADVVALYEYSDFIEIGRDASGKILYLGTNTPLVNGFVRSLALRCENALSAIGKQTAVIPAGAFTGSALMSNSGPKISVDITFFSTVRCDFVTTFENVGINQTRHSIYAKIDVLFNTVLPIAEHEIFLTNNVLVAENVLIGEIPGVYVGDKNATDYLDLIP